MGQNLLASITHVNVGDVVVILVLLVIFWLDYAQVRMRRREEGGLGLGKMIRENE
jgi:hypothetical protein